MLAICFEENDLKETCQNSNFSTNYLNLEASQSKSYFDEHPYQKIKENKVEKIRDRSFPIPSKHYQET